jgi:N-acetylglucosaminyldiphosphoundecaprenol N-acetyl-beta-D-mannosaminyltransferase
MRLHAVKILEINITTNSKSEILEYIRKYLHQRPSQRPKGTSKTIKPLVIVTPNPEQIVFTMHDPYFADILNRSDISLPDGVGISWAYKILNKMAHAPRIHPVAGIEFMENLVSEASGGRVSIALIGGREGLAVKTLDCLSKLHPKLLNGWADDAPEVIVENHELRIMNYGETIETKYVKNHASLPVTTIRRERYFEGLIEKIQEYKTQIIFVGLGAPKQEYFIEELMRQLSIASYQFPIVLMSVGGSFDEISGNIPRAPHWVYTAGLKWLWRLVCQPWRIVRQLALLRFVALVVHERYRTR